MTDTAYIVTATKDSSERVERYLYSYATIVGSFAPVFDGAGPNLLLIKVEGDRALAFAEGQADRLSSGLHFSRAFATEDEARAHVEERFR